ncbi:MAG TPA: 50S ribosomal protein L17 [Bacteroidales bacterium]|nr:50S ribosomal protein L17 [Bacteroidales bacterium]HOR81406.1 50S ribosomal protein L17 [Bacteroidales bacterium]HPJ90581.1 50S ribosomal protein L17 [Bacteroidales bacterium]
MRHGKKVKSLGRKSAHRKAMLSNMATSLIMHKRITTTVAKAKALRKYIEPLITKAKTDSTHSRRIVFSYLQDKAAITELFREISPKIADRPGGYTRILRTGFRIGDGAEMCIIELVDYNDNYTQSKGAKKAKAKTTRRGRGKGKKEALETTSATTPIVEEKTTEKTEAEVETTEVEEKEDKKVKEEEVKKVEEVEEKKVEKEKAEVEKVEEKKVKKEEKVKEEVKEAAEEVEEIKEEAATEDEPTTETPTEKE